MTNAFADPTCSMCAGTGRDGDAPCACLDPVANLWEDDASEPDYEAIAEARAEHRSDPDAAERRYEAWLDRIGGSV